MRVSILPTSLNSRKSVQSAFLISGLLKAGQIILSLGLNIVLARAMSANTFGQTSFFLATTSLLAASCHLGLPLYVIKNFSLRETSGALDERREISQVLGTAWIGAGIAFMMMVGISSLHFRSLRIDMLVWAMISAMATYSTVQVALLKSFGLIHRANLLDLTIKQATFVLAVLVFVIISNNSISILGAGACCAVGYVFAISASSYLIRRRADHGWQFKPSWNVFRRSSIFIVTGVGWALSQYLDLVIVAMVIGDTSAGIYRIAALSANMAGIGSGLGDMALSPKIVRLFVDNRIDELRRLCGHFSWLSTCICVTGLLVFSIFGSELLQLVFGYQFRFAYIPGLILMTGQLIVCATGPSNLLLLLLGGEKSYIMLLAGFAIIGGLGCLILGGFFGLVGASISTAIAISTLNIGAALVCYKKYGVATWIQFPKNNTLALEKSN